MAIFNSFLLTFTRPGTSKDLPAQLREKGIPLVACMAQSQASALATMRFNGLQLVYKWLDNGLW